MEPDENRFLNGSAGALTVDTDAASVFAPVDMSGEGMSSLPLRPDARPAATSVTAVCGDSPESPPRRGP